MTHKKVTLLNTSIVTNEGMFRVKKVTDEEAREIWRNAEVKLSAIGHRATADLLSVILSEKIEANRINYVQQPDETALVIKTNERIPEGVVLSDISQIKKIGYHFEVIENVNVEGYAKHLEDKKGEAEEKYNDTVKYAPGGVAIAYAVRRERNVAYREYCATHGIEEEK